MGLRPKPRSCGGPIFRRASPSQASPDSPTAASPPNNSSRWLRHLRKGRGFAPLWLRQIHPAIGAPPQTPLGPGAPDPLLVVGDELLFIRGLRAPLRLRRIHPDNNSSPPPRLHPPRFARRIKFISGEGEPPPTLLLASLVGASAGFGSFFASPCLAIFPIFRLRRSSISASLPSIFLGFAFVNRFQFCSNFLTTKPKNRCQIGTRPQLIAGLRPANFPSRGCAASGGRRRRPLLTRLLLVRSVGGRRGLRPLLPPPSLTRRRLVRRGRLLLPGGLRPPRRSGGSSGLRPSSPPSLLPPTPSLTRVVVASLLLPSFGQSLSRRQDSLRLSPVVAQTRSSRVVVASLLLPSSPSSSFPSSSLLPSLIQSSGRFAPFGLASVESAGVGPVVSSSICFVGFASSASTRRISFAALASPRYPGFARQRS